MWQPPTDPGLSPVLKDVVDIIDKLVGTSAIVAAGLFAYFKFFKERVYRPRLEPEVSARFVGDSSRQFLKVVGGVKNTGLTKVDIELKPSCLRVFGACRLPSDMTDEPTWEHIATLDVADRHEWVEPQERLSQTWLVVLPKDRMFPAYRIEFRLVGEESEWYAETVVTLPSQRSAANEPAKENS